MLINVGFEDRVKMLKLDVSYQRNDEDLRKVTSISSRSEQPQRSSAREQDSALLVPFLSPSFFNNI